MAHAAMEAVYRIAATMDTHAGRQTMSLFSDFAFQAVERAWLDMYPETEDQDWRCENTLTLQELVSRRNEVESTVALVLSRLPIPQPHAILAVEQEMEIHSASGFGERMVVDLVLRTGEHSAHVRDWKWTAINHLPRATDLYDHDQLAPYALGVRERFPWLNKITVGLYSLTSRREVIAEMPLEASQHIFARHEETAQAAENTTEFPATPDGVNCTFCPVRDGCPLWDAPAEND